MEDSVDRESGGIRSLLVELRAHGEAINFDLMQAGWTRSDIGRRLSWRDLKAFVMWLPPTGDSALYRARKPNSWWVTAELQFLSAILYAVEGANWQRGGGQGNAPKPFEFPKDHKISIADGAELDKRRRRLKKRTTGGDDGR